MRTQRAFSPPGFALGRCTSSCGCSCHQAEEGGIRSLQWGPSEGKGSLAEHLPAGKGGKDSEVGIDKEAAMKPAEPGASPWFTCLEAELSALH